MRITTHSVKNMFGKVVAWNATLVIDDVATFDAQGPSADRAKSILALRLAALNRDGRYRRYWHTLSGETFCLYRDFYGWAYDITRPGQQSPSTCLFESDCTEARAVKAVESHVAQFNAQAQEARAV